jgi:hypothetical protein
MPWPGNYSMREVISEKFNSIGHIQKDFEGRGKGEGENSIGFSRRRKRFWKEKS